jgi:hypothetical protein
MGVGGRVVCALALALSGCGGGDGDGGGSGGAGGGGSSCNGAVSGAVAGDFSSCVSAINFFPDGTPPDSSTSYFIYSLVAAEQAGSTLDAPLESLGINLYLAGDPATKTYALTDALPDTMAHVYAPYPTAFEQLGSLTLKVDQLTQQSESTDLGYRVVLFHLKGSFDMSLKSTAGETVTVSASF